MTTPTQNRRPDTLTLLAFAGVVLFLGVNFVAVRFSNRELAPAWGGALRFAIASALLLAVTAMRRVPLPRGRALAGAVGFGALAFGGNFAFLYRGLLHVPSGMASIVFACIPLLTLAMAVAVGLERLRARAALGALIALAGIALIFREQLTADVPLGSILLVLGAAVCAAASGIVVKRAPKSHPIAANAVGMAVGALMLGALAAVTGETPTLPTLPATWAALAWLVASSCVAFVLMVWVIGRWTATASSYSSVIAPLITVSVALWLAGEAVTLTLLAGGALVLAGVYVGALSGAHAQPTPTGPKEMKA